LSIQYPTSSVRVQYTTFSVGISTPNLELLRPIFHGFPEKKKFNKYRFQIGGNIDTIWRVEQLISPIRAMKPTCKHPKVRIVSRHEDTEFLECLDCGYVFDSDEFRDMEIEDTVEAEAEADPRLEDS
jgi:Zn ribbon nucleic-acid-binding protein